MTDRVRPVPEGHHTITPHLVVKGASQAIEFYKQAFGAEEIRRVPGPDGKSLLHAEIKIGDSRLFLVDEFPEMGCQGPGSSDGSPVTIHLFVEDVDSVFNTALAAGAKSVCRWRTCSGEIATEDCSTPSDTSGRWQRTRKT